jgi:hypothetical protein
VEREKNIRKMKSKIRRLEGSSPMLINSYSTAFRALFHKTWCQILAS